jgi:hypothetical protein
LIPSLSSTLYAYPVRCEAKLCRFQWLIVVHSDYVSTTFPEDIKDDDEVFVIAMTFFLNDVGKCRLAYMNQLSSANLCSGNCSVNAVDKLDPLYPKITEADFIPCGDSTMVSNQVWGHYARKHWN